MQSSQLTVITTEHRRKDMFCETVYSIVALRQALRKIL